MNIYINKTFSPFLPMPTTLFGSGKAQNISTQDTPRARLSFPKPPRTYLRSNKKSLPKPFFELLSESWETARLEPIPRNRLLLKSLCKGKGVLRKDHLNQIYLEIDSKLLAQLGIYLHSKKEMSPFMLNLTHAPNLFVISFREAFFQSLFSIEELGEEFSFEIEGLYSVTHPIESLELEQIWFLKVRSPELEKLRQKYFLPALANGHPFCIPIAAKFSETKRAPSVYYRISPSVGAA